MSYYNDYYSPVVGSGLTFLLWVYFLFVTIGGTFALVSYIIKGLGLYNIAKRQGKEYPWLAFVPFARTYLHGEVGGDILLKKRSIRNPGIWMILIPIIEGMVGVLAFVALFAVAGYSVYTAEYVHSGMGTFIGLETVMFFFIVVIVMIEGINQVLHILVNHQILERFTTNNMAILHAVLMGFIPMYEPVCLFIMGRKPYNDAPAEPVVEPVVEPAVEEPVEVEEAEVVEEPVEVEEAEVVEEPVEVEEAEVAEEPVEVEEAEVVEEPVEVEEAEVAEEPVEVEEAEVVEEPVEAEEAEVVEEPTEVEAAEVTEQGGFVPQRGLLESDETDK